MYKIIKTKTGLVQFNYKKGFKTKKAAKKYIKNNNLNNSKSLFKAVKQ